ncbi:hypothetical protein ACG2LH_02785 [Zhouia sp. PK063]|uniref:hypothetical protein n=1 Tax=Zhouia sp. PK063 TaxID=3373602 RepID=UPI00379079D4
MKYLLITFITLLLLFGILITTGLLLFSSRPSSTHFKMYSVDKKQCISIITRGNSRYIINGPRDEVPTTNYIQLDISHIDDLGDEIGVCWNKNPYHWKLVNDGAIVVENKLDTLHYQFFNQWERDKRGIPTIANYHEPDCGTIDVLTMHAEKAVILVY